MLKKYWYLVFVTLITVGLGIGIFFTSSQLKQEEPIAPSVPQAKPQAAPNDNNCKVTLTFAVSTPTPTPTGTVTPTPTSTATPTPTGEVTPTPTSTPGPSATPTPTSPPGSTPTPTTPPVPQIPVSGNMNFGTAAGILGGILLVIGFFF